MPYPVPSRGLAKPPPGVGINWGHPLSAGLAGAWGFNERAGGICNDAIRLGSRLNTVASPTWTAALGDAGLTTLRTSSQYAEAADGAALVMSSDMTVVWYGVKNEATSSFNNLYAVSKWSTGAAAGTNEWTLLIGNGDTGAGENLQFNVEIGVTPNKVDGGQTLTVGAVSHAVGVRRGTVNYTYLNGARGATTTTGVVGTINSVGRKMRIGSHDPTTGTQLYTSATTFMAAVWSRALSDDEVKFHAANPYCIFGTVSPLKRIATAYPLPAARTLSPRFLFFDVGEHRT